MWNLILQRMCEKSVNIWLCPWNLDSIVLQHFSKLHLLEAYHAQHMFDNISPAPSDECRLNLFEYK